MACCDHENISSDSSAITENASMKLCRKVSEMFEENRSALGFPDETFIPYFLMTNDLCAKVGGLIKVGKEKGVAWRDTDVQTLLTTLVASYDDPAERTKGCCAFYHSIPEEIVSQALQEMTR